MCIVCKGRFIQSELFRYQISQGEIVAFSKNGRSFYVCLSCLDADEKKLKKALNAKCKCRLDMDNIGKKLKEITKNG